ncbi:MAG: AAA family ATPase [Candidatus Competibacteraceae bacterium]|nr:AAA family ATPase [Candidatus Competibacteraceae bacterium]MCP5124408.1 AAA family ATPase [Gammaproteobacteria bacterium]
MTTKRNVSPLPYGVADFVRVRTQDRYYIDKTAFIPRLATVFDSDMVFKGFNQ